MGVATGRSTPIALTDSSIWLVMKVRVCVYRGGIMCLEVHKLPHRYAIVFSSLLFVFGLWAYGKVTFHTAFAVGRRSLWSRFTILSTVDPATLAVIGATPTTTTSGAERLATSLELTNSSFFSSLL